MPALYSFENRRQWLTFSKADLKSMNIPRRWLETRRALNIFDPAQEMKEVNLSAQPRQKTDLSFTDRALELCFKLSKCHGLDQLYNWRRDHYRTQIIEA